MDHWNFNSKGGATTVPEILITDTNRTPFAARLAIGLSNAGSNVSAVCPIRRHFLLKTRAVRRTFPYSGIHPLESLTAAIESTKPSIVVPCDDRGVEHLHELYARARSRGAADNYMVALLERSLGSPDSYPIVSSRFDLLSIAREEGLRVPETKLLTGKIDLKSWRQGHLFPWVLKADGTNGGRGVRIAHTLGEAEDVYLEIGRPYQAKRAIKRLIVNRDPFWLRPWWKRSSPAVIVQSHVQGRPANCAVACWEGRILAGLCVEVVSAQGLTGPAIVVRVVENREMMIAAERIASRLGLSGFFGLDFMIEDGSDEAFLIEMNPRCTPLCHLQLGKGRDMVGALWTQLSGQSLREAPPVTQNDLIAYFPQAWTSKSDLLQSSFQDMPRGEPDLVQELLRPWPDRSLLFRLASKGHNLTSTVVTQKSPH